MKVALVDAHVYKSGCNGDGPKADLLPTPAL